VSTSLIIRRFSALASVMFFASTAARDGGYVRMPYPPIAAADIDVLETTSFRCEIDSRTGNWSLLDKAAGVRWPTQGTASPGTGKGLEGGGPVGTAPSRSRVEVMRGKGSISFELDGDALKIHYDGKDLGEICVLEDALAMTDAERGAVIVPCREGLLIPSDSGVALKQVFGTSEYEGCHMNMLGVLKSGAAMLVLWDDAYVWPEVQSTVSPEANPRQRLTASLTLRRSARTLRLVPLGKGDWNRVAAAYRKVAQEKGLAVTLREKIRRNAHGELLIGAANVKLWTCLARRMNEDSTKEESVQVNWTFDEAAAVAEHIRNDLRITRCLFIMGGWTAGGYDCRHPDNLPANPECGGDQKLADAVRRIQALGYVACLHDNYQDMYRDAKSWNPDFIEKRPDGSLIQGGRWLGGRAYMVCAPKQLELAMRPQNLPEIRKRFGPWGYFIDTTYAVGPRECADPNHPLNRNGDIAWKIKLSDKARELFGLFGSECGREWALPHSDFFEGLVGVSGRYYHNLRPGALGARVIPFWEMVYHDCQICYGKYGYPADQAAEYVAHHVLCARPLNYHSIPDHLYWTSKPGKMLAAGERACFTRTDSGWAEGLHPTDAFLKTTHEVLGPLHEATAHQRLTRFEYLAPNGTLRQAVYGEGDQAVQVVVNFGQADAKVESPGGGSVVLPPWGFVVDGPRLAAFYAKRWNDRDYPAGALFVLQAAEGQRLRDPGQIRVFHGFGDPTLIWRGKTYDVRREQTITLASQARSADKTAARLFRAADLVFGAQDKRVVRVLATHTADSWIAGQHLDALSNVKTTLAR
jgi:hypothetical protein